MRRFSHPGHPVAVDLKDPQEPDPALIRRAQRGDIYALESLYLRFESVIYTLGFRLCGTEPDAEDVLQETFLELSRCLKQFRWDGSFSGWLKRICTSKALMRLRRLNRLNEIPEAEPEESATRTSLPSHQLRLDVEAALGLIGDTARVVVWLHDVEGYTHDEIAELMGGSPSFSKSQLSRAHLRLRRFLSNSREDAVCNT